MNLGEFFEHRNGLGFLVEPLERLCEQRQGFDVARVGLEADLQFLQRTTRIVATDVQRRQLTREIVILRLVPEQTLGNLEKILLAILFA